MVVDGDLDRATYVEHAARTTRRALPASGSARRGPGESPYPRGGGPDDPTSTSSGVLDVTLPRPATTPPCGTTSRATCRALDQRARRRVHVIHGYQRHRRHTQLRHRPRRRDRAVQGHHVARRRGPTARARPPSGGGWFPLVRRPARSRAAGAGRLVTRAGGRRAPGARQTPGRLWRSYPPRQARGVIDVAGCARSAKTHPGTTVTDVVMSALAGRCAATAAGTTTPTTLPTMGAGRPARCGVDATRRARQPVRLVLLACRRRSARSAGWNLDADARSRKSPSGVADHRPAAGPGFLHPGCSAHHRLRAPARPGVTTSVRAPTHRCTSPGCRSRRLWGWAPCRPTRNFSTSIIGYGGQVHVGFQRSTPPRSRTRRSLVTGAGRGGGGDDRPRPRPGRLGAQRSPGSGRVPRTAIARSRARPRPR